MSESKMVPREPTQRMLDYGAFAEPEVTVSPARRIWRAMYDAAPTITEPRIGTPERQAWQDAKNREANERMEVIKINEGGAMCSVGPVNITGVATGSRNGPASESDPPSPDNDGGQDVHVDSTRSDTRSATPSPDHIVSELRATHCSNDGLHDQAADMIRAQAREIDALRAEVAALRAERDKYHDALVSRHGGESIALLSELDAARAENERLQVQLAGCGVAAGQNTETSKAHRIGPDAYGWSASYADVCRAVDREIALRAENEALRADAERYRHIRPMFRAFSAHVDGMHSWCATGELARMKGPTFDAAIDAARKV